MVKLYSQPGCGQCRAIHTLLDKKNIQYEECQDIDYMISIGIKHTPVLEVDDKKLIGAEIFSYINGVK